MKSTMIIFVFCLFACANKQNVDRREIARSIVASVKDNKYQDVISSIASLSPDKEDTGSIRFYVNNASMFFLKYGIPAEDSWQIVYDTISSPIVKLEQIVIPIFKGYDSTNHLEEAYIRLSYDYTRMHVPDSLVGYELVTQYRPRGKW
jgi:hypothetical protein